MILKKLPLKIKENSERISKSFWEETFEFFFPNYHLFSFFSSDSFESQLYFLDLILQVRILKNFARI